MIAFTTHNAPYLPMPNRIEIVVSDELCDLSLSRTAFLLPMFEDGSFLLANNINRGGVENPETPGGHIDPGETSLEAAIRECMEEVGCTVRDIRPVGFLRMISEGTVPENWRYPHPLSYQQFYTGIIDKVYPYVDNPECGQPVRVSDLSGVRPSIKIFGERAREMFGVE